MIRYPKILIPAVALFAACDIPTELPKWNPEYAIELEGTTISVAQLLPASVTLANNNSAFSVAFQPVTFSRTLAQLCPACGPLHGQVVPKPAFNGSLSTTLPLPADVEAAVLQSGAIRFDASHNFSFDPLRPGLGNTGSFTITARSGNAILGSKVITGAERAFPPGITLTESLTLSSGTVGGPVEVLMEISSPAGGPTLINTQAALTVTATPRGVLASSAQIRVSNRPVSGQAVQINLTGIDQFIIDRVRGGKLVLRIANSFGVTGTLNLAITGGNNPILKSLELAAGTTSVDVPFTEAELRSILGRSIIVSLTGSVSATAGANLTPASAFSISPLLVLQLGREDA